MLTDAGILETYQPRDGIERYAYRLTDAGRELFPVVVALVQWGDRWIFGPGREPMEILDCNTGSQVQRVAVQAFDGRTLSAREVVLSPGPGALPIT